MTVQFFPKNISMVVTGFIAGAKSAICNDEYVCYLLDWPMAFKTGGGEVHFRRVGSLRDWSVLTCETFEGALEWDFSLNVLIIRDIKNKINESWQYRITVWEQ